MVGCFVGFGVWVVQFSCELCWCVFELHFVFIVYRALINFVGLLC